MKIAHVHLRHSSHASTKSSPYLPVKSEKERAENLFSPNICKSLQKLVKIIDRIDLKKNNNNKMAWLGVQGVVAPN